jgi:hypothetical protein
MSEPFQTNSKEKTSSEEKKDNISVTINNIVTEIQSGKCILIMGPEFYFLNNNEEEEIECMNDYFNKVAIKPGDADNTPKIKYLNEEGLFYCENDDQLPVILSNIRSFYGDLKPNLLYEKIAQIPFPLYFSLSPDTVLEKTFENLALKRQFSYYMPGNTASVGSDQEKVVFSRSNPLIYNLMGKYDEKNSLVFSYETLFWFIANIFQKESATKTAIKESFSKASYFLFMGFRFDKWYLKLLFFLFKKVLQTPDDYKTVKKIAYLFKKPGAKDNILSYYKSEFNFEFPAESQKEFLEKLWKNCSDRGILRKNDNTSSGEINEIEILIRQGQINEVIRKIKELNYSREFEAAISTLKLILKNDQNTMEDLGDIAGSVAFYKKAYSKKDMTFELYEVNLNKIKDRINDIINLFNLNHEFQMQI